MINMSFVGIGLALSLIVPVIPTPNPDTSFGYKVSEKSTPVYITEWETSSSWGESNSTFGKTYVVKRTITQLTNHIINKGVVLVFVKGYDFNQVKTPVKPVSLPFYMFSPIDNENAPLIWSVHPKAGEVQIGLQIPSNSASNFEQTKDSLQFRYFVIPDTILRRHKLTSAAIHNMSYQQVVQLLSVTP